jgi:phosphatidylserine/phosphatidylglycerophosphate/cardiolipin synthase-like enzyme
MTKIQPLTQSKRYIELVSDRTIEKFLTRLFLRDTPLRYINIVAPYISAMSGTRFSLMDLRKKVERERVPMYVITRAPSESYQQEAMKVLWNSPWIEIRYNASIHAKVYVANAQRESESFALFGSSNLTAKSIESNIEVAILIYSKGPGKEILRELSYWAGVRLRTLEESRLVQPIKASRR